MSIAGRFVWNTLFLGDVDRIILGVKFFKTSWRSLGTRCTHPLSVWIKKRASSASVSIKNELRPSVAPSSSRAAGSPPMRISGPVRSAPISCHRGDAPAANYFSSASESGRERLRYYWLANVFVHPSRQALLPVPGHSMSGHGDDVGLRKSASAGSKFDGSLRNRLFQASGNPSNVYWLKRRWLVGPVEAREGSNTFL
jgi:hypothetical protein